MPCLLACADAPPLPSAYYLLLLTVNTIAAILLPIINTRQDPSASKL